MERLPIFLDVRGKRCVVIGGGEIALRKARLLARAGARLCVAAPAIEPELAALTASAEHQALEQVFSEELLDSSTLVIAATDDDRVNEAVSVAARARNIPVNVVDQPRLCTFIVPSIVDRSPIVLAVSSGGSSPVLLRKIKELNEIQLPAAMGDLARLLQDYRKQVKQRITNFDDRLRFWESVMESDIPELVYSGNEARARARLEQSLNKAEGLSEPATGEVYLVGAGPGDPDLLTLRALRLMHKADVVLYDRLVSDAILKKVRADADKIYVGKQRSDHSVQQEGINDMLVRLAKEGKRVMRLKGGDPFIFGRGGEELDSLARAGLPFQVVPGITAASGCAAYAGIPLTHRDHAQSVRFLTGHLKNGELKLDWENLVSEQQTLVFYMGLFALDIIATQLQQHGMASDMPIALIEEGTNRKQRILTGTLADIVARNSEAQMQSPTLIIIGRVVTLRDELAWR